VRSEGGYTLVELLAVTVILGVVLTGLVTVFTAGSTAELELNRRFESQENARLALERMRRELHCASAVTASSASSVTLTLPAGCFTSGGAVTTVTYSTASLATSRYTLNRNSQRVADYLTTGNIFTYTAQSTSSLGRLHVDLPVNRHPNEGWRTWRLIDDIALRNTSRT
jgi:prepilin-type N-terminal cleavage/methylation domain-containing protein